MVVKNLLYYKQLYIDKYKYLKIWVILTSAPGALVNDPKVVYFALKISMLIF
jgi:hypothetical protein